MSRKKTDYGLTGGTGDVNPQWFKFPMLNADNTLGTQVISYTAQTPLPGFNAMASNKAVVMEVLKVMFQNEVTNNYGTNATVWFYQHSLLAGGPPPNNAYVQDGIATNRSLAAWHWRRDMPATADVANNTPVTNLGPSSWMIDVTDGAGHGVLLATPNVTYGVRIADFSDGTINIGNFACAFLYRFKEVSLSEYIGIQNSQNIST